MKQFMLEAKMFKKVSAKSIIRKGVRLKILISVFTALFMAGITSNCSETSNSASVQSAYEARISGKVDGAKAMLEQYLANNPENAAAHFELARTHFYMATGDKRQEMENHIDTAREAIDKALEIEPDNIIYNSLAAKLTFFNSYMTMQMGQGDSKEEVSKIASAYEKLLELQPEYGIAMLYLAELYGSLPDDMGGDSSMANQYTEKLERLDPILGAKAREITLPEDADKVEFWQKIVNDNPDNAEALAGFGKAYLRAGNPANAEVHFAKAIKLNPERNPLWLDIARYHMYSMMSDTSMKDTAIPAAEDAFNEYLATEPIAPLKAYAVSGQARLKYIQGNKDEADKLAEQANTIDPYYSKASAIPDLDLLISPDEIPYAHSYMFQPF
jgi:tetratricopeptide (TPR) repeat protein